MPWRCPSCRTTIAHSDIQALPHINTVYRCPVCHLELMVDMKTGKLALAPMKKTTPRGKGRSRSRGDRRRI